MRRLILLNLNLLKDFAGAWIFYTVLPKIPKIKPRFTRIARFAPLIGVITSLIQSSLWIIFFNFGWPKESLALLVIASGIFINGGLHLDGLIDTADGIAAGKEKQLKAMKDSRIGSIGVLALITLLIIQISSLLKLGLYTPIAIIIASFWSKFSSILAINNFQYLHKESNSISHKKHWKGLMHEGLISFTIIIAYSLILFILPLKDSLKLSLLSLNIIGLLSSILVTNSLGNFLKGHTGDSYGASVVLVETAMLFCLALILPAM